MVKWPKDNQTARNAFYGDPGKGQIASQMVPVVPPFAMYYDGKRVKAIQFHRKAAPALLAALTEIWDYCQHDQAKIDAAGVSKYAGAYNPRMVRGSATKWSNHAYAAAIDLNAAENGLYAKGNMPQFVIDAFCRQGWMWGGWYTGRKDPMHFEAVDNGGRVPKSSTPRFGAAPAAPIAHPETGAPADEFEDHPAVAPQPAPPSGPDGALIIETKKKLDELGYHEFGILDAEWGGRTVAAISAYKLDRGLSGPAEIDDALTAQLNKDIADKWRRPMPDQRTNATVQDLAPHNETIKQNWWTRLWAKLVAIPAGIGAAISGVMDKFPDAKANYIDPVMGFFSDVPGWLWFVAAGGAAAAIWIGTRKADTTVVQQFQDGRLLR